MKNKYKIFDDNAHKDTSIYEVVNRIENIHNITDKESNTNN